MYEPSCEEEANAMQHDMDMQAQAEYEAQCQ